MRTTCATIRPSFVVSVLFSEPKIPQSTSNDGGATFGLGFSALQRAENSSISRVARRNAISTEKFQCSSASRKFLNPCCLFFLSCFCKCFSALQRAENSSIGVDKRPPGIPCRFQCSSASRKFLNSISVAFRSIYPRVSVLFSEPKIPQ